MPEQQEVRGELFSFQKKIEAIKMKRGENDATLWEVNISSLGENEKNVWEDYENILKFIDENISDQQKQREIVDECKILASKIKMLMKNKSNEEDVMDFFSWVNNRLTILLVCLHSLLDPEQSDFEEENKRDIFFEKEQFFRKN